MITLNGTYADKGDLQYVCRAFRWGDRFYDGVGNLIDIEDGDVLLMLGQGTWFALFKPKADIHILPS